MKTKPREPGEYAGLPPYDPLPYKWKPEDWDDLIDKFDEWLNKHGAEGNLGYLNRCGAFVTRMIPEEPALIVKSLRMHGDIHAWVQLRLADLGSFAQHSKALAPEKLSEVFRKWEELKERDKNARISRQVEIFERMESRFKALNNTIEFRVKIMSSLNANARQGFGANHP